MVKKFSAILIAICVVFTMFTSISFAAAEEFEVTCSVDYDNSVISFEVTTPARYRQHITVTLITGDTTSDVVRVEEVHADNKGYAKGSFQMTESDPAGTYTIKASGAGYLASVCDDTIDVYYETYGDIYNAGGTLEKFNNATVSNVGALLLEKKGMFLYDFEEGSDYDENTGIIHTMFIAIRTEDYEGEYVNFTEVQDTMTTISAIREIAKATSHESVRALCEKSAELFQIDTEHADYKTHEAEIYKILISLFNEKAPETLSQMRDYLQRAIAIAKLNRVDAAAATDVIRTYGDVLGIDVSEYNSFIAEYDEVKFNYAFVGMNYTTATQVVKAYEDRKDNPPAKAEKPSDGIGGGSGGGSGGGGGGGSFGGGSKEPVTPYPSIEITGKEEENSTINETLTDISSEHWAYESVKTLSNAGVINGFEDGTFRPEEAVTREQFIKMLVGAFNMTADGAECSYSDVPKDAWYYSFVAIATEKGITKGYGDIFGTGASITREDAAVMIYRIIEAAQAEADNFSDDSEIADYAKDAVYALAGNGVINGMGDGSFAPKANLTRAQAAKIIYTALKYNVAK